MDLEAYWAQTRKKWAGRVTDPCSPSEECGFCVFGKWCADCPVVKVYGVICDEVDSVLAYSFEYRAGADTEKLSVLAEAVVQELDDRKAELIEAMRELREVNQD